MTPTATGASLSFWIGLGGSSASAATSGASVSISTAPPSSISDPWLFARSRHESTAHAVPLAVSSSISSVPL